MPREVVHGEILAAALAGCGEQAVCVRRAVAQFPSAARLGALAPDAPYFYRAGRSALEEIGERIHGGKGEDTWQVPRALLEHVDFAGPSAPTRDLSIAFLAGFISHCVVDAVFHPMVYYFSGDYYDPIPAKRRAARAAHRLIEVYLDAHWRVRFGGELFSLAACVAELTRTQALEAIVEAMAAATGSSAAEWRGAFLDLARLQRMFLSPVLGAVVRLSRLFAPGHLSDIDALFAFGRGGAHAPLDGVLTYKNPVTGEVRQRLLADIRVEAIQTVCSALVELERVLGAPTTRFFDNIPGPSLNSGLIGTNCEQMQWFSPQGLALPGLGRTA